MSDSRQFLGRQAERQRERQRNAGKRGLTPVPMPDMAADQGGRGGPAGVVGGVRALRACAYDARASALKLLLM